ncbi:hypothetical protein EDB84DRAFT_1443219 [Lactarius hengduanensis]|nr:hypothetical protein EDB84DRAFT_1443219 [Lactarius hengduanensis]
MNLQTRSPSCSSRSALEVQHQLGYRTCTSKRLVDMDSAINREGPRVLIAAQTRLRAATIIGSSTRIKCGGWPWRTAGSSNGERSDQVAGEVEDDDRPVGSTLSRTVLEDVDDGWLVLQDENSQKERKQLRAPQFGHTCKASSSAVHEWKRFEQKMHAKLQTNNAPKQGHFLWIGYLMLLQVLLYLIQAVWGHVERELVRPSEAWLRRRGMSVEIVIHARIIVFAQGRQNPFQPLARQWRFVFPHGQVVLVPERKTV